jgi:hypothetical protein
MSLRRIAWLPLLILAWQGSGVVSAQQAAPAAAPEPAAVAPTTAPGAPAAPAVDVPATTAVETPEKTATEVSASPETLANRLTAQGLENVVVQQDGSQLRIAYENRRYRWGVTGLGVVLAAAAKDASAGTELVVIPKIWGVPELEARVKAEDYQHFLDGSLSDKEFARRFTVDYRRGGPPAAGKNRSFGRTDVTAGVGYRASFTTEDPNEGIHPRFIPGLEGALFPGIGFSAQQSLPLDGSEGPKLLQARAGGVLHPAGPVFLALSGGRLSEDLDAVQAEAAWLTPSGRTSLRMTFAAGRDQFFAQSAHSSLLTLTQWIGNRDIAVGVVGGRFWEGDQGAEIFLQSGFRERRFIIGGGRSGGVTRTRFQVILPLGPRVESEPKMLRFKIRDTFTARYRAPKGLITEARVGGVVPSSLLEERSMLFSSTIVRSYLKELRRSADLLQ